MKENFNLLRIGDNCGRNLIFNAFFHYVFNIKGQYFNAFKELANSKSKLFVSKLKLIGFDKSSIEWTMSKFGVDISKLLL